MEKSHPKQSIVTRLFPSRELLEPLGHAVGEWCAEQPAFASTFDSREAAHEQAVIALGFVAFRPTLDSVTPTAVEHEQLNRTIAHFTDAYWRGGCKARNGKAPTNWRPLSFRAVQRAFPNFLEYAKGLLGVKHGDFVVVLHHDREPDGSLTENQWVVKVMPRGSTKVLVEATVYVAMSNVGPWIMHWTGRNQKQGLRVVMEVLRKAFGDSLGLKLSKWKLEQSEKDRAARSHTAMEILPPESTPILLFEPDRGEDNRRAALIQRNGSEDTGVFFTVTIGPFQNVPDYLKRRDNTLITENIEADRLFLSGLRQFVEFYLNRGTTPGNVKVPDTGDAESDTDSHLKG